MFILVSLINSSNGHNELQPAHNTPGSIAIITELKVAQRFVTVPLTIPDSGAFTTSEVAADWHCR